MTKADKGRVGGWQPSRLQSTMLYVLVAGFWLAVIVIGGWLWGYMQDAKKHSEELEIIETSCNTMGAEYDLYYDDGSDELPLCRVPSNDEEWRVFHERRAYREGLRNGDIEPDAGDASSLNEYPY